MEAEPETDLQVNRTNSRCTGSTGATSPTSSGSGSASGSGSGSGSSSRTSSSSGTAATPSVSDTTPASRGADRRHENLVWGKQRLLLPRGLCETPALLRDILTEDTWKKLEQADRDTLETLLPKEDPAERKETLRRLFNWESFRFESPLRLFQHRLKTGLFKPELQRGRALLKKAEARRGRHQRKLEWYRVMQEVLVCREKLLSSAGSVPPGVPLPEFSPPADPPYPSAPKALYRRARRRYFEELSSIKNEVCGNGFLSEDENYPDDPPSPRPVIKKRNISDHKNRNNIEPISTLGTNNLSLPEFNDEWRKKVLANHLKRKCYQPEHPELFTSGITLDSILGRTHFNNSHLSDSIGGRVSPGMPAAPHRPRRHLKPFVPVASPAPQVVQRPLSSPSLPETSESENEIFEPSIPVSHPPPSIPTPTVLPVVQPVFVQNKVETKPVDEKPPPEENNVELVQATHSCFFSVLRDLVCSTPRHCMPLLSLTASLRTWRQNPIAPLNHWYSLADDWIKVLPSAVAFLTGEGQTPDDFVPYLQYKPTTQVYQWIGAGRDTDSLLTPLCTYWLAHRQSPTVPPVPLITTSQVVPTTESNQQSSALQQNSKLATRWQLTTSELESFRIQEKERFQKPHKAFTYRLLKGDAVVGPLRGVYASEENPANRVARGHTLLCPERPRHVTLLALVRDAVACLPNGEGTRAHITTLLRRSQYLVADANEQTLQAAVSGALDRMHCAPDPCVKYLPTRKLWIYLHRERTEEEFERLHAENQAQGKLKAAALAQQKKSGNPASKSRSKSKTTTSTVINKPIEPPISSDPKMTSLIVIPSTDSSVVDLEGDDMNIDVEGSVDSPVITIPGNLSSQVAVSSIATSISSPTISSNLNSSGSVNVVTSSTSQQSVLSHQGFANSERKNMIYSAVSGTSLLQPRANVLSHTVFRQTNPSGAKSVVRVLNSSTTSSKSLISPRALQPTVTSSTVTRLPQTQTKMVVQRAGTTQTSSGALSPAQQRLLLESLMQHQRTHGQPMTHDQLLQTIQTTQKLSTPTATVANTSATTGKTTTAVNQQTIQLAGQTVQLPSGQTVQLTSQAVQLAGPGVQTVQLGGQTVQLGGQTVHLGNQTIQFTGQSLVKQGNADTPTRVTVQRQSSPLVAKILTNTQLRGANPNIGNRQQLRVTNLSLAQLQGKPVLLHTSPNASASDILLQASNLGNAQNSTEINATGQRVNTPTTQQHTLLLSNIGGQVVRVASGGSTLLGSTLRLQTTNSNANNQNRGAGTTGVILQGGQTLKLQTAPIRLHQNTLAAGSAAPAGSRVLLASGTRLQGLKLLPVQQTVTRGATPIGSRQVYARIVSPGGTSLNAASPGNTTAVMGGANILNIGLRPSNPSVPVTQQSTPK